MGALPNGRRDAAVVAFVFIPYCSSRGDADGLWNFIMYRRGINVRRSSWFCSILFTFLFPAAVPLFCECFLLSFISEDNERECSYRGSPS